MRRIATLLLVFLMSATARMSAQDAVWWDGSKDDGPVTLDIQLGMNLASWNVERWSSPRTGVNVGVMAEIPVLKTLCVNTGLLFTMKGTRGNNDGGFGGTVKAIDNANYLEIPVLAVWRTAGFREGDRIRVSFGPYFAVGIGGSKQIKYSGSNIAQDSETDKTPMFDYIKRFDWGLSTGVSYSFNEKLIVGFTYEAGLMNIQKDLGTGSIRQSNISISLAYKFLAL